MILLLDNYDSFTYNVAQYLWEGGAELIIRRNDAISISEIRTLRPQSIIISPGPGRPEDAGISVELIRELAGEIPILGICLGHQAIGDAFGGRIDYAPTIFHGKVSLIHHDGEGLFAGIANPFTATRYHSLVISPDSFPEDELRVTSSTEDGIIMSVRHRRLPIWGVQFHPESILTEYGKIMLNHFVELAAEGKS